MDKFSILLSLGHARKGCSVSCIFINVLLINYHSNIHSNSLPIIIIIIIIIFIILWVWCLRKRSVASFKDTCHENTMEWDEMKKFVEEFLSDTAILWWQAEGDVLDESSFFNGEEISDWFSFSRRFNRSSTFWRTLDVSLEMGLSTILAQPGLQMATNPSALPPLMPS